MTACVVILMLSTFVFVCLHSGADCLTIQRSAGIRIRDEPSGIEVEQKPSIRTNTEASNGHELETVLHSVVRSSMYDMLEKLSGSLRHLVTTKGSTEKSSVDGEENDANTRLINEALLRWLANHQNRLNDDSQTRINKVSSTTTLPPARLIAYSGQCKPIYN